MKRRGFLVLLGTIAVLSVINAIAWESKAFCDFYVRNIYSLWVNIYGRLTGIFPFSVGEVMVATGVIATVAAILLGITAVIFLLGARRSRVYPNVMKLCKRYFACYIWVFAGFLIIMTLNCFIPFHSSTLEEKYGVLGGMSANDPFLQEMLSKEYTLEELAQLRDYVVIKTNELAKQVDRDKDGNIIYSENIDEIAIECMQNMGVYCDQLQGYYPGAKEIKFSGFLSQQHMKGYFFPFSMEANYNGMMHPSNLPATICHEYSHLKGFLYEDEANLIGFLACINSSDVTFRYSGYLSILNYVNNEFYDAIGRNEELYASHVKISPQVKAENVFLAEEAWEKVEAKAVMKTEVVDKVSDKFTETTMVLNGVEDGMRSYTRVVGLLLQYYDGSAEMQEVLADPEYLVQSE